MRRPVIQILGLLAIIAAALCLCVVVVLSLVSSPSFSKVKWLPRALAHWADYHDNFRHFPGYAVLAIFVQAVIPGGLRKGIWVAGALSLMAAALEVAQIWIPGRTSDWHDFAWGVGGIAVGSLVWFVYFLARNNWISRTPASSS